MKKVIYLIAILSSFCVCSYAEKSFSAEQLALRNSLKSFLQSEGFVPTIDSDGDIKFKRNGDTYYILVSDNNKSPMYIKLAKYFNYSETVTKTKINLYAAEVNLYKMAKLTALDNSYSIGAELFLTSSSAFTTIFYKLLDVMDDAESEFKK